jgi:hypothetical protein
MRATVPDLGRSSSLPARKNDAATSGGALGAPGRSLKRDGISSNRPSRFILLFEHDLSENRFALFGITF